MTGATRKDLDSAGGTLISGSPNVIINGHSAVRIGDSVAGHGPGAHAGPVMASGSPVVLTNMIPQSRADIDTATCGHPATGSSNVMVGGDPYPMFAVVEPGVMLIAGSRVYDDTTVGHVAKKRDEDYVANDHDSGPSSSTEEGTPTVIPPVAPAEAVSCEAFGSQITKDDMAKYVSKYFTLGDCGMMITDQPEIGFTANQIACNWKALCVNVLDPLYAKFGFKGDKGKVNSGFRTVAYNRSIKSSDTSDHCRGCAADITLGSTQKNVELFKYIIASGLPFSQLIYEGRWVHISYGGKKQGVTRVMWTRTGGPKFTHCGYNGELLDPNWNG